MCAISGESKEAMDAYTSRMLASLGASQPQQGSQGTGHQAGTSGWASQEVLPKSEEWQDEEEQRAGKGLAWLVYYNQGCAYTPYLHYQTVYTVRLRYGTGNRSTVQACMATRFEARARPPLEIFVPTTIIILYLLTNETKMNRGPTQ